MMNSSDGLEILVIYILVEYFLYYELDFSQTQMIRRFLCATFRRLV